MQTWMKSTLVVSMFAAGTLGAGTALAHDDKDQDHTPRGEARGHEVSATEMQERMARHHTERMERLEQALQLTEDQQDEWEDFKEAMAERHERAGERIAQRAKQGKPETAIEGLKLMEERAEIMQEEAEETREAVEDFYPHLSVEQKKAFDKEFTYSKHKHHKQHRSGGEKNRPAASQGN